MAWTDRIRSATTAFLGREKEIVQSDSADPYSAISEEEVLNTVQHPLFVAQAKITNHLRLSARPLMDQRYNEANVSQWPKFWAKYNQFYQFAQVSDTLQIVFQARKREIFRRGIGIVPVKGDDNSGLPIDTQNVESEVHAEQLRLERVRLQRFIDAVNANGQKMKDLGREYEDDQCVYDDGYVIAQFEYEINNSTGKIESKQALEFIRQHPANMRLVIDRKNRLGRNQDGHKVYFSLHDRTTLITEEQAKKGNYLDKHGHELIPAHYMHSTGGFSTATSNSNSVMYYGPWEVYHDSEFNPSITYSKCPPIKTCWMKVWTLVKMDEWIMKNYALQRPPKFFMVFNTSNPATLEKEYQKMIQRAQADPHIPQILANEHDGPGGGVEVVDLMRSLEEMQWVDSRREFREQIGAVYGVMPIWQADLSTSGGLNNEGMQITVTNRAIEDAQIFYNEGLLPWMARSIGAVHYTYELLPSEELDESAELERQHMKMQNAQLALQIGLQVDFNPDTGEFTYSGTPELQQNPMGGFPGFGGGNQGAAGVDTGFDSDQDVDGTPADLMQSDGGGTGFQSPRKDVGEASSEKETIQADVDEVEDLAKTVERGLIKDIEPRIVELRKLAEKDPRAAQKALNELIRDYNSQFRDQLNRELRRMYDKGHGETASEFNKLSLVIGDRDEAIIQDLLRNQLLQESINGLHGEIQQQAFTVISSALRQNNNFNLAEIRKELSTLTGKADAEIKQISRTHTNKFFQAGRRAGYVKAERALGVEFRYAWMGPDDHRTTDTSKRIKARVAALGGGNGVLWDELVQIVIEESKKDFPDFEVDPRAPTSHYNSRHHAFRKV